MALTIYAGTNTDVINRIVEQNEKNEGKKEKNNVFAGNLNLVNDPIAEKKKKAQEAAWKIVSDAWNSDIEIDNTVQERRDLYNEMKEVHKDATEHINEYAKQEAKLKELYGVDDDSKEQKDLELLKKQQDCNAGVSDSMLTADELEQIKNIDMDSLTEYQKRALELNSMSAEYKKDIRDAEMKMEDAVRDITSIRNERLKSHAMVDATKQADAIMEAASKEIIGDIVQKTKENIDEKQEEQEKKEEKEQEKKEEKEEQLEKIEEQRAIEEAMILRTKEAVEDAKAKVRENNAPDVNIDKMVDIATNEVQSAEVKQSLDEIKNNMNLLEADLKGIKVDETL